MSRDLVTASFTRCLLVWAAVTLAGAAVLGATLPGLAATGHSLTGGGASIPFDRLLVRACEGALALCAVWLWLVTSLVVGDAARGAGARRRGVPDAVRRAVLAACGVALGGGLLVHPTQAGALPAADRPGPAVLHGLPLPDRATTATHVSRLVLRRAAVHPSATRTGTGDRRVPVRPGDTLWGLARDSLPEGSSAAEIDRRWRSVYDLNRDVVGADPDLIHPGQRLRLPPHPNRP